MDWARGVQSFDLFSSGDRRNVRHLVYEVLHDVELPVTPNSHESHGVEVRIEQVRTVRRRIHERIERLFRAGIVSHVFSDAIEWNARRVQAFQQIRFTIELMGELPLLNHQPGVGTSCVHQVLVHAKRRQTGILAALVCQGK